MITFSDALFIGRYTKLRHGGVWSPAPESQIEEKGDETIPIAQARERCYHFAAARLQAISPEDLPMKRAADIRQADAKLEMLKAGG